MKFIYTIVLSILMSFNALAQLAPNEQKLADLLLSGDIQKVKSAAKAIRGKKIADPALIDIAAEVLLTKYPHAYSSDIDALAWLARAIGTSENGRYHSMLLDIIESSDQKKLVRHVKKAISDLGDANGEQYTAGMYQLPNNLYSKEDDNVRDERIMALLTEGSLSNLKQGARAIADNNLQNQALTDIAAEILISLHANATDGQIDTLSWLAKAVGQSKSGRYVHVLTEVEEKGAHRKLRNYADDALEEHGQAKGEQYQKGMLGKQIPSYDY